MCVYLYILAVGTIYLFVHNQHEKKYEEKVYTEYFEKGQNIVPTQYLLKSW